MLGQMSVPASDVARLHYPIVGIIRRTKAEKPAQRGAEDEVRCERRYLPPRTVL
jgi:hypothetical protein